MFFEPENQAIEAIRTEITDLATKIKAAAFEPKKEAGNATNATTPAYVMKKPDWRELKWSIKHVSQQNSNKPVAENIYNYFMVIIIIASTLR